jgi:N-acetyl-gamma-glutamyl-phosphate reductase
MAKPKVFIDGEAGTTGLQIRARLEVRRDLELLSIDPARRKDDDERARLLNEADLAVLCLPDAAARASVAMIANPGTRVLDASTAHRVAPGWVYGFPELLPGQADLVRAASRVSVPGCYPTGATALVRPLVDDGLLPADWPVAIHGASGYSGGGRQLIDANEGRGEHKMAGAYRAYGLDLAHKHLPEMRVYGGLAHLPIFTPSVGGWRQGMLVHVALHLWALPGRPAAADLHASLARRFAGQPFIQVMPMVAGADAPVLAPDTLNGSNRMELFVFANPASETAVLVARLDNLGKGASGAAAQNLDLMLGLEAADGYALAA